MADNNANRLVGGARAALGQGLGMGWGDEAEAWLRSKSGEGSYEDLVKRIREEYGQYAKENPYTSGTAEFVGGAAPGVAMLMAPGGKEAGAAQLKRSTLGALGRLGVVGGATGAVSGAGSAVEGERGSGALTGGLIGTTLGLAVPTAMRATGGASKWLRERLFPTESLVQRSATGKMAGAMQESNMSPKEILRAMERDKSMGVPSVVANTNPALVDLAEAVAQRTGKGARKIENTLTEQKLGSRERTQQQVTKGLKPGDYYDDLEQLQKDMRTRAGPAYDKAYSYGEVTDPEVLKFLKLPQFQEGLKEAEKLLAAEGRVIPKKPVLDPATGAQIGEKTAPTVEMLDQLKRGLDALIEKETDAVTGKTSSMGRVYTQKKNEFLSALDAAVPDYELARGIYKGGAELSDAMRKGINEFGRMDHEQVMKLVAGMGEGEKQAFRTGVARDLYDKIMKPSGNFNSAQRIIGSPEMQAKMQPLFDNPAQFNLFKNSLEREAQLFGQANKVLGGSPTGKRIQMRESLEEQPGVGEAMVQGAIGNWGTSLSNLTMSVLRKGQMNEKTAAKLSDMLMSKDPHEVAAVVKLLEEHAAQAVPKAVRASAAEAGAVTGAAAAFPAAPIVKEAAPDLETEADLAAPALTGPDIEEDIRRMQEKPAQ